MGPVDAARSVITEKYEEYHVNSCLGQEPLSGRNEQEFFKPFDSFNITRQALKAPLVRPIICLSIFLREAINMMEQFLYFTLNLIVLDAEGVFNAVSSMQKPVVSMIASIIFGVKDTLEALVLLATRSTVTCISLATNGVSAGFNSIKQFFMGDSDNSNAYQY